MRITNEIPTVSFDSLEYGEFFSFVNGERGNINVKVSSRDYRPLINGRLVDYVESVGHAMVFPIELSTCRYRRGASVKG